MHDLDGDRDQALADYRAALAVSGAPEEARSAAQRGIEQSLPTGGAQPVAWIAWTSDVDAVDGLIDTMVKRFDSVLRDRRAGHLRPASEI